MKCTNCGNDIKEGEKFCIKCGKKIEENVEQLHNNNLNQFNNQRKKSHAGLIAGIFALAIITIIAVIIVISFKSVDEIEKNPGDNPTTNEPQAEQKEKYIEFNEYTFTVPADCTSSVSGNQLFVYGPGSKWVGVVMMQEGSYDTLVTMKDQIKTALSAQEEAKNYDLTNAITEEKTYGGKSFLITRNIKSESYSLDISYGKADENHIYIVSITKSDSTELTESERIKMYSIVASGNKIDNKTVTQG